MKTIRAFIIVLVVSIVLAAVPVLAADTKIGVQGENEQILTSVTTVAGTGELGEANGAAISASFRSPQGLLALSNGAVLIADSKSHLIRHLQNGQVSAYAGITFSKNALEYPIGGLVDSSLNAVVFQEPQGMDIDAFGNICIADAGNHAIRKIDRSGQVTTIAGTGVIGNKDGNGKEASFYYPQDVAVAPDGKTLYVADTLNHAIRKISPDGKVTTLNALSDRVVEVIKGQVERAGDFKDGKLSEAKFNEPSALAFDAKGGLYVSDSGNQRIRYIDLAAGQVTTVAGESGIANGTSLYEDGALYAAGNFADGPALQALFNFPKGLAATPEGGLIIADSSNHSVRYLFNGTVTTLAGDKSQFSGSKDGVDRYAQLQKPSDVALLPDGSILVADAYNNRIRKISFYRFPDDLPDNDQVKVLNGSSLVEFAAQPEIENGRTFVPIRAVAEAFGYKVEYEEEDQAQAVRLSKGNVNVEMVIGQNQMKRIQAGAQKVREMDVAPYISSDLTYLPLRFFSEEMGLDVQWNGERRAVILREKN